MRIEGLGLDPDRIGRIGERQFEVLCERAGFYCNKSAVDVMGSSLSFRWRPVSRRYLSMNAPPVPPGYS